MNPKQLEILTARVEEELADEELPAIARPKRVTDQQIREVGAINVYQYQFVMLNRLDEILINNAGRLAGYDDEKRNKCDVVLGHVTQDGRDARQIATIYRHAYHEGGVGDPVHYFRLSFSLEYFDNEGVYERLTTEEHRPRRIMFDGPTEDEMKLRAGVLTETVAMLEEAVRNTDLNPELAVVYQHEQNSPET
ncbi:hypothetical protein A3E49_01160 [Candidatus Saccharibacteria bacterium RIFCSPHIGHO2_12_FULL_49_19]|nr:MAG: hypothetical protein A3E49_01160 [Candidatus Saccharibacteria bacterium RIFCSPHIGHO2_12_FULL_49_19]